jgi:hypothetical protein
MISRLANGGAFGERPHVNATINITFPIKPGYLIDYVCAHEYDVECGTPLFGFEYGATGASAVRLHV